MRNIYDSGYKYLFSHKAFVRQLLEGFIPFDWVKEIDFDRIEQQKTSFIRKNYRNRESDVIYKLYYKNVPFYIYILLEFQSSVDYWMAFRMLSYEIDLYEEIIRKENLKKLPAVFPVLIYNGDERWDAPDNLEDLIEKIHADVKAFLPAFRYFKIIINEFSRESLLEIKSILSTVFLIENLGEDELNKYLQNIVEIINSEIDAKTKAAFVILKRNWFAKI